MEEQQSGPKRRVERRAFKDLMPLIIILCVLLAASIYFLIPQFGKKTNDSQHDMGSQTSETVLAETSLTDSGQTGPGQISFPDQNLTIPPDTTPEPDNSQNLESGVLPGDQGGTQVESTNVSVTLGTVKKADKIESFFELLDTREYIQAFNLGEKSSIYFPALIQRLVDNPPIVTGETNDLFTILQNTAHFFRIIGKKNIIILKGILDREKATFEQTLADFYELTEQPQYLSERFNLNLTPDSLYLYSGFFLNTMGGRLYLFRRDSMSRMVVNFYAVLIIENANRQGRNQYGIEIKSSIDSLIDDIESSKVDLKMRDYYLDTLYNLKVKYQ